jgi:hypothetical protein
LKKKNSISTDKHTKTLYEEAGLPSPTELEKVRSILADRLKKLDITYTPNQLSQYALLTIGKQQACEDNNNDRIELYNAASQCYEAARHLCDCLAFEIFM